MWGTNAEVVVGNRDWMVACAGAAGPALEGGVSHMGMPAAPGVIDRFRIEPHTDTFKWHTINDQAPKGICGSGFIDLAAQLFLAGMIDNRGRFEPDRCGRRLKVVDGLSQLQIVSAKETDTASDLLISQVDLDSLFRSKAAMFTILETITDQVGLTFDDLDRFYVAGTFGLFIDPRSAIAIGMIPDLASDRIQALGNTSLAGAARVLTDADAVTEIDHIRDRITYLELNVNPEFMTRMSAAKFLPHTDRDRFPSVKQRYRA